MTTEYSKKLGLHYEYRVDTGELVFEDGTRYTVDEAIFIAECKLTKKDLEVIHRVMLLFDGEIVTGRTLKRYGEVKAQGSSNYIPQDPLTQLGESLGPIPYVRKDLV